MMMMPRSRVCIRRPWGAASWGDQMTSFEPSRLTRSVIAPPLQERLDARPDDETDGPEQVVIELNARYAKGLAEARSRVQSLVALAVESAGTGEPAEIRALGPTSHYLAATLSPAIIREVVGLDRAAARQADRAIYRIWPDFPVRALVNRSVATVKADAARLSFAATGSGVVWAVLDSGIQGDHPHFALHRNLELPAPLEHLDFTASGKAPLTDTFGHGTHVAGIIAGELVGTAEAPITAVRKERDEHGDVAYASTPVERMAGMAPRTTLLSYRVLDENGNGSTSAIIAALEQIQQLNGYGRDLIVHGVNLSVGYPFDPEWFACGQSPLCVEVDRLVRSGVVVVAAAGNTGYGWNNDFFAGAVAAGIDLTINDPGNAELAITVGSTHRDMPHRYGVSYFSSKGPTGDGRAKPDLLAPGERILSCAAGKTGADAQAKVGPIQYVEDSGTSMAAPHVSGCIAAFLSIRPEFQGRAEQVKDIFLASATDLGRVPAFQGRGLVDLMRAIQSV